jgi:hypothetical protein
VAGTAIKTEKYPDTDTAGTRTKMDHTYRHTNVY